MTWGIAGKSHLTQNAVAMPLAESLCIDRTIPRFAPPTEQMRAPTAAEGACSKRAGSGLCWPCQPCADHRAQPPAGSTSPGVLPLSIYRYLYMTEGPSVQFLLSPGD